MPASLFRTSLNSGPHRQDTSPDIECGSVGSGQTSVLAAGLELREECEITL